MSRRAFTDDEILRAIRAAASTCGEPLSHATYGSVSKAVAGPSPALVIQRFGSWRQACTAAGVTSGLPARDYVQRWDRASVTAVVAAYLTSEDCSGTFAGYEVWARTGTDRPSGATVRNVMGGWSAAKAAAQLP